MKKIFSLLLVFVILSMPAALAEEIDLSKFSYQELQALYRKVRIEMIQRPEWKDVIVHQGIYVIGKDIPEGDYEWELRIVTGATVSDGKIVSGTDWISPYEKPQPLRINRSHSN